MIFKIDKNRSTTSDLFVIPAFKNDKGIITKHWDKKILTQFSALKSNTLFKAEKNETYFFSTSTGESVLIFGLGDQEVITNEMIRKSFATLYNQLKNTANEISINLLHTFENKNFDQQISAFFEGIMLASYEYNRFKSKSEKPKLQKITLILDPEKHKEAKDLLELTTICSESVYLTRDLVNDPPNVLNSETYAKLITTDAKKLSGVKIKLHDKKDLLKLKMGMFLSVNAGSNFGPRLVHLEYTPKKKTKTSKHIALVGKGLTFDTGGYSLKPGASMINMKTDMAGSATVYAAFKAAVRLQSPHKISCFLGITDNAVSSTATMPDSIVTARNGKTVEIANTDAEGRLVLGDVINYACSFKPDCIIDAATLTGAVLVALGSEICGLMGNNKNLTDKIKSCATETDEYIWELPIIQEFRDDMKSAVADLRNIGSNGNGGSCKAAAFLENFVEKDIAWAHLDVAGVVWTQGHLPYCPPKSASGLMVRTLINFLTRNE